MSSVLYAANSAKDENGKGEKSYTVIQCTLIFYTVHLHVDQVAHVQVPPMNLQANLSRWGKNIIG